jgi:hypothetical protein
LEREVTDAGVVVDEPGAEGEPGGQAERGGDRPRDQLAVVRA